MAARWRPYALINRTSYFHKHLSVLSQNTFIM